MDDDWRVHPDDDPDWLPPEDLTDDELGIGRPVHPDVVALNRRRALAARARWLGLDDGPTPEPVTVAPERVGTVLRALRWHGRMNQRELAGAAGVPSTTVDRLESGQVDDPRLSTVAKLVAACGLRLAVVADEGTQLAIPVEQNSFHDAADRLLPAHLRTFSPRTEHWWGNGRYHRKGEPIRTPVRASRGRRLAGTYRNGEPVDD